MSYKYIVLTLMIESYYDCCYYCSIFNFEVNLNVDSNSILSFSSGSGSGTIVDLTFYSILNLSF